MNGKNRRLTRLGKDGKYLIVPIDHGMTLGPIQGIEDPNLILKSVRRGHIPLTREKLIRDIKILQKELKGYKKQV